ncbi:hypothetical protein HD554DRAFT_2017924 [Boletus coccyginus]|nr:hypothetical protein HD554DRAFT_2017924 [Boletus coccyginus]
MSDPVASKSTFLCMYMTNHPDTLVAYVKHFGEVPGNITSAEMKSIDCKGMNLSYSLKSGGVGSVHVKFDPPLAGYDDVKPRLLAMKADAQEALGMLKSPKITSFRLPSNVIFALYFLLSAAYFSFAPPQGTALLFVPANIADTVFMPARVLVSTIGFQPTMRSIVQSVVAIHGLECFYTWYLCGHYVKGSFVTVTYISATLVFGFLIWADLKKRVQEKHIESIMKAE